MSSDETPQPGAPLPDGRAVPDGPSPDGLELARALTRASASVGEPRKRRSRKPKGEPRAPRTDDRDPQTLDATISRLVADHGWDLDLRMHGVFSRWAEIVGAENAAHSTPETMVEGVLTVRADSTAWATNLQFYAPSFVRRLNEELGHDTVTAVKFLPPKDLGPASSGKWRVKGGKGQGDTYG